jgi:hypothetical protein
MNLIKSYIGEIILGTSVTYWTFFALSNPELTQTQLFLELWWLLIPIAIGVITISLSQSWRF